MKLVDVEPIRYKRSLVHFNRGSEPHSWEYRYVPVYPEYPDGQRLKDARQALNLSQREAALRLGVSTADYSQLEHGRKTLAPGQDVDRLIDGLHRQTGRTTRQLEPLVAKALEGKRAVFICHSTFFFPYVMRIVWNILLKEGVELGSCKRREDFIQFPSGGSLLLLRKGSDGRGDIILYDVLDEDHYSRSLPEPTKCLPALRRVGEEGK